MNRWNEFYGPNAGYVIELYERYRQDSGSVDPSTRAFFENNPPPDGLRTIQSPAQLLTAAISGGPDPAKVAAAITLAQSIRWYGHRAAVLDPLGHTRTEDPALYLETYGLTEAVLRSIPASFFLFRALRKSK